MDKTNQDDSTEKRAPRAIYERPAIEQTASFERLQLACAHHALESPECTLNENS